MHRFRSLFARRIDQTEYLAAALVEPILEVLDPMRSLDLQVTLMRAHDRLRGQSLNLVVLIHVQWPRRWTVDDLAHRVASSRSILNDRFVRLLCRAPIQYLADWRIQLATSLLRTTTLNVAAIAYQVGYDSEEAFNRAFKRAVGLPPGQWRQQHATGN